MTKKTKLYPVLPLRDIVVFPQMVAPLFVGREKSIRALEAVMDGDFEHILLITQKNSEDDAPGADDLHDVGVLATVMQMLKLPDGTVKILTEAIKRVSVSGFSKENDLLLADVVELSDVSEAKDAHEALMRSLLSQFEQYMKLNKKISPDVLITINQITDPERLTDSIASYFPLKLQDKQALLESTSLSQRMEMLLGHIESETGIMQTEKKIRGRIKRQMEKTQREYYLNEQLKAIHKELGENEEGRDEISEIEDKVKSMKLSAEAKTKAESEIKKLRMMNQASAEASVVRNYLEWLLTIPWKQRSKVKKDLVKAQGVLDTDHYGLDKVKERITEYLAVQARVGKIKSQILCLVGPPGVGKTSLGKSIAKATGRNFVRIALGGVRDEAEIRGHRRTYIGSMPGKIVQGMKKAKTSNPLFLLDEIDKMANDYRGDPASALLEVLDPEQNHAFNDHYLEVDYDLSDVMFVTTANTMNMPQPLMDRMEVIRLAGYSEDEKMEIAKRHLINKQMKIHGLKKTEFSLDDEALRLILRRYTREAGVRNLEREVAKLCRKAVKEIVIHKNVVKSVAINVNNITKYLGSPRFTYGLTESEDVVGVTTGLAWTAVGGELLSIEVVSMQGSGKTRITGKLGEVMQESVHAALSYIRSRSAQLGIHPDVFEKIDLHVHVPEGAIPKDGPSAGITITTSLVSVLTGIPVVRDVAMTGEVTLRGHVLPIGGLKEKLLAAHRGGIKVALIPHENKKDLEDIPDNVKEGIKIMSVRTVEEVLDVALSRKPTPIEWEAPAIGAPQPLKKDESLNLKH